MSQSSVAVEERAAALRAARVPYVLARVVRAEKPTSAKAGDAAVVFTDGTMEGFVGGACAESTVRAHSLALLDSADPLLLVITPEPDDTPAAPGSVRVHNECLSGGTLEIFLEPVVPEPRLLVVGDGPIAVALAQLASAVGWDVSRSAEDVGGAAAVVVASHGRDEEGLLATALAAGVPYVALVASRKRGEAVVASLPVPADQQARVRTPAGLDIGARTPPEVALSVLAEVVAERRRPSGRPVAAATAVAVVVEQAVDPVCGMTVAAVDASLHLDHDGARYWFCGTGCLRAFAADPSGYVTS